MDRFYYQGGCADDIYLKGVMETEESGSPSSQVLRSNLLCPPKPGERADILSALCRVQRHFRILDDDINRNSCSSQRAREIHCRTEGMGLRLPQIGREQGRAGV